jgi:hypothetical protein
MSAGPEVAAIDDGIPVLIPPDPDLWRTDLETFVMPEVLRLTGGGDGSRARRKWTRGSELMVRQYPLADWVVRGLVSKRSITIIGADPKASKTWCLIDMALAVTSGGKAFGEFKSLMPPCSPVALFLNEDSERSVKNRLRALSSGYGYLPQLAHELNIIARQEMDIGDPIQLAHFIADVRQLSPRPVMVGLDPLRNLHSAEESSSTEMRPVLRALAIIRELCDCAVVVVHHSAKATQGDKRTAGARLRGSSAIDGFRDGLISLEETEKADDGQSISNRVVVDLKSFKSAGRFGLELKIEDDEHGEAIKATWVKVDGNLVDQVAGDRASRREAAKAAEQSKKEAQITQYALRRVATDDGRKLTQYVVYSEAAAVLHCRPTFAQKVLVDLIARGVLAYSETTGWAIP